MTTPALRVHEQAATPSGDLASYSPPDVGTATLAQNYGVGLQYDGVNRVTETNFGQNIKVTYGRGTDGKGQLRTITGVGSGSGTSPFATTLTYGTVVGSNGGPGALATVTRDDIATSFTWQGPLWAGESTTGAGIFNASVSAVTNSNLARTKTTVTAGSTYDASFAYDADGLLTCLGTGAACTTSSSRVDFTIDSNGLLTGAHAHSGAEELTESWSHNAQGEVASHHVYDGAVSGVPANEIASITYDNVAAPRDKNGRIKRRTVALPQLGDVASDYSYDARGQLWKVQEGAQSRAHVYDSNGNRLCTLTNFVGTVPPTGCSGATPNSYDEQDRLVQSASGTNYSYSARGTLYQKLAGTDVSTFTYDPLGNLTAVSRTGTAPFDLQYVIDGMNRRVAKKRKVGTTWTLEKQYVWSDALRIEAELSSTGALVSRFIYGNRVNVPELIIQGSDTFRVITDQLGSPILVVNVADPDDILLEASYDEWGKVKDYRVFGLAGQAWPIPFGFAGGLYDEDTGFVRFGARDYDPTVGRWTAKDPILFGGGQGNLYVYVGNGPVNRFDPLGLEGLSSGVSVHGSTVNPFTSSGGDVVGINLQTNWDTGASEEYSFEDIPGQTFGLDVGVAVESVWAYGQGSWTGEFRGIAVNYGVFAFSLFWSPDYLSSKDRWLGFTAGLGAGLPGVAYERTNYSKIQCK